MIDWITWTVEAIGVAIFCIWAVVPVREFGGIFRRLKGAKTGGAAGNEQTGGRK